MHRFLLWVCGGAGRGCEPDQYINNDADNGRVSPLLYLCQSEWTAGSDYLASSLTSPMVMFARLILADPTSGSSSCFLSIIGCRVIGGAWFSGKVYRIEYRSRQAAYY